MVHAPCFYTVEENINNTSTGAFRDALALHVGDLGQHGENELAGALAAISPSPARPRRGAALGAPWSARPARRGNSFPVTARPTPAAFSLRSQQKCGDTRFAMDDGVKACIWRTFVLTSSP